MSEKHYTMMPFDVERERAASSKGTCRVYIAGPMSGLPDYNYPAFNRAASLFREAGFEVVNPAELDWLFGPPGSVPRETYLRQAVISLGICHAIYLLPGWQTSPGALLELHLALELGLPVIGLPQPLGKGEAVSQVDPHNYSFKLVVEGPGEVMERGEAPSVLGQAVRAATGLAARVRGRAGL